MRTGGTGAEIKLHSIELLLLLVFLLFKANLLNNVLIYWDGTEEIMEYMKVNLAL
jgi:hypothetical protein